MKYPNFVGDLDISAVALFARAWIEITWNNLCKAEKLVALFARAWIEMPKGQEPKPSTLSRPLCEGVD